MILNYLLFVIAKVYAVLSNYYSQFSMTKEQLISETLFEQSERVMNKDYSEIAGSPELVAFKKNLFNHIHNGIDNIDDAKTIFEKDIVVIRPVLDEIEATIDEMLPEEQTIVIKDGSFLEKIEQLEKIVKTVKKIE